MHHHDAAAVSEAEGEASEDGRRVRRFGNGVPSVKSQQRTTKYAIEINGEVFSNGAALRARMQQILDKYIWPGCPPDVSLEDDDASFFIELVRSRDPGRVPEGDYIKDVARTTREGQVGRHLMFVYGSGERDMIGWSKLCAGPRKRAQEVSDAMRQSILPQMLAAYARAFQFSQVIICPKSGLRLSTTGEFADDTAVVHHDGTSFASLRDEWMQLHEYAEENIPIADRHVGGCEVAPGNVRDSWQAYHALNSTLVVVSKKWHDEHHVEERRGRLPASSAGSHF